MGPKFRVEFTARGASRFASTLRSLGAESLTAVDAVDVVRDGGACGQGGTLAGGRARGGGSGAARGLAGRWLAKRLCCVWQVQRMR